MDETGGGGREEPLDSIYNSNVSAFYFASVVANLCL